jgi:anionic cell wall polymer biosynthesis LytR-Cps2A-Psr (LCP) family protein
MKEEITMIENKGKVRETEIEKTNTNRNMAIEMTENTKKIMMTEIPTGTITEITTKNYDVAIQVITAEMTVQVD